MHDRKSNGKLLRIGSWNIRTMQRIEKLENIERETNRNELNAFGSVKSDRKRAKISSVME